MPFDDYSSFIDEDLHLPYRGKTYTVHPLSAQLFMWLTLARAGKPTPLDKMDDLEQAHLAISCLDEMLADGATAAFINHVQLVLFVDASAGRGAAEQLWSQAGAYPEPLAVQAAASTTSPSTGEANQSTPRTARSTRPTTSRKAKTAAAASNGSTSSKHGR